MQTLLLRTTASSAGMSCGAASRTEGCQAQSVCKCCPAAWCLLLECACYRTQMACTSADPSGNLAYPRCTPAMCCTRPQGHLVRSLAAPASPCPCQRREQNDQLLPYRNTLSWCSWCRAQAVESRKTAVHLVHTVQQFLSEQWLPYCPSACACAGPVSEVEAHFHASDGVMGGV
jgi:hypothetical protein